MRRLRPILAALAVGVAACSSGSFTELSETATRRSPNGNGSGETSTAAVPPWINAGQCAVRVPQNAGGAEWVDRTVDSGIDDALVGVRGHATAAGDVNVDGYVDLFVGGFADRPIETYQFRGADGPAPDRLLLGGPNGFVIDDSFPTDFGRTSGAAFADLDNDLDLDLVVARNPRDGERASAPSAVYENIDGSFQEAVLLDSDRGGRSIGVLDFDGDGLLDLFLVEDRWAGADSVLLHNEGGFTFSDQTTEAGLPRGLAGLGVATVDLDRSGTADLFVTGANRLFVSVGSRFEEVPGPFAWEIHGNEDDPAGVAVGDVNADGWLDLVVGQHFNSTIDSGLDIPVRLYLHQGLDGDGRPQFIDATDAAGIVGFPTKAPHIELTDIDGDGDVDIVTTASTNSGSQPAILLNDGGENPRFAGPSGLGDAQYWVAGAVLDVDHDSVPEFLAIEWEPALGSRLFAAPYPDGAWVSVQVGESGALGVGAVVEARPAGAPADSLPIATVPIVASTGYGSGSQPLARLGLGSEPAVDLVVQLPNEGPRHELNNVPANAFVIVRGDGSWDCRP